MVSPQELINSALSAMTKNNERLPLLPVLQSKGSVKPKKSKNPVVWPIARIVTASVAAASLITIDELGVIPKPINLKWAIGLTVSSTLVSLFPGGHYYRVGLDNLRNLLCCHRPSLNMSSLVTLSSLAILVYSPLCLFGVFANEMPQYRALFVTLAALNTAYLLREAVNRYVNRHSRQVLPLLNARLPKNTLLYDSLEDFISTPSQNIKAGDVIKVPNNTYFPVDGRLRQTRQVQDDLHTGEITARQLPAGAVVEAGTLNLGDDVEVEVTCDYNHSYLVRLIDASRTVHPTSARQADKWLNRIISIFVPFIVVSSLITFLCWFFLSDPVTASKRAINVLLGACPCTLGFAKVSTAIGKWVSVRKGVLLQHENVIDKIGKTTLVAFDKTGTLTQLAVKSFAFNDGTIAATRLQIWRLIYVTQQHRIATREYDPYAKLMTEYAREQLQAADHDTDLPADVTFLQDEANGITVRDNDKCLQMGSASYLQSMDVAWPSDTSSNTDTMVGVALNNQLIAHFSFQQQLRPNVKIVIHSLKRSGKQVVMLTGDTMVASQALASDLNLTLYADLSPDQKVQQIKRFQANHKVLYVGDGANDGLALQQADCGVVVGRDAMSSGNADSVIDDLSQLLLLPKACQAIRNTYYFAVGLALLYNLSMMACGSVVEMDPMIPGIAMAMSSLLVLLLSATLIPRVNRIWNHNNIGFFATQDTYAGSASSASATHAIAIT